MRILIVSTFFPPRIAIGSMRAYYFAKYWSKFGENVTVLTSKKTSQNLSLNQFKNTGFRVVEIDCFMFRIFDWFKSKGMSHKEKSGKLYYKRKSSIKELLFNLKRRTGLYSNVRMPDSTDLWAINAINWCRHQGKWDVVFSCFGPYTVHVVGSYLRTNGLAKIWVADFRDLWTDNFYFRGIFPINILEKYLENRCLNKADLITTVSPGFRTVLQKKTDRPIRVIYNGYEDEHYENFGNILKEIKANTNFYITYTGTIYPKQQSIQNLMMALRQVNKNENNKDKLSRYR
jgi:glycosyltransferase involved in cell wall biosynthesis